MKHFLHHLLIGLTTVFAWAPATILLIMPFIGLYTGWVYMSEMDTGLEIARLLGLCVIALLALAGYAALSAICWGLRLPEKAIFPGLICGSVALGGAIVMGYLSNNPLLHITLSVEHLYLFVCPLFFLLLHAVLAYKKGHSTR